MTATGAAVVRAPVEGRAGEGRWQEARALFDAVALSDDFVEFLTIPAYDYISG